MRDPTCNRQRKPMRVYSRIVYYAAGNSGGRKSLTVYTRSNAEAAEFIAEHLLELEDPCVRNGEVTIALYEGKEGPCLGTFFVTTEDTCNLYDESGNWIASPWVATEITGD